MLLLQAVKDLVTLFYIAMSFTEALEFRRPVTGP